MRLEIENPYSAARVSFRGAEGTASFDQNRIVVTLPRMEVYAAVLIEKDEKA